MKTFEYFDLQIGPKGQQRVGDVGGGSIESCAELVQGQPGDFDIRRSAEWGGGIVATIRAGELQIL